MQNRMMSKPLRTENRFWQILQQSENLSQVVLTFVFRSYGIFVQLHRLLMLCNDVK